MTVEAVGMFKTAGQDPSLVRPIGMRNPYIKSIHKETMRQNKGDIVEVLEPEQLPKFFKQNCHICLLLNFFIKYMIVVNITINNDICLFKYFLTFQNMFL